MTGLRSARRHPTSAEYRQPVSTTWRTSTRAGGIAAIFKELDKKGIIHRDAPTVDGRTMGEIVDAAENYDTAVVRPIDDPYYPEGGLRVLRGNLSPDGCVVKQSAVPAEMRIHTGPARVFDSEEEAVEAIFASDINEGDVVVIRYEGPRGGPGMREMLTPTSAISGMGLSTSVALITDGQLLRRHEGPGCGACESRGRCRRPHRAR